MTGGGTAGFQECSLLSGEPEFMPPRPHFPFCTSVHPTFFRISGVFSFCLALHGNFIQSNEFRCGIFKHILVLLFLLPTPAPWTLPHSCWPPSFPQIPPSAFTPCFTNCLIALFFYCRDHLSSFMTCTPLNVCET